MQKRVSRIVGEENKLILEDGSELEYDVLALNVGSKTKDTNNVKGVWEHSLTTRPINDLLGKIRAKEDELKSKGIVPTVVVCGGGAAGTELSMAFKKRWTKFFGQDIKLSLIAAHEGPVAAEVRQTRDQIELGLKERGIDVITNAIVTEVKPNSVLLKDGREIPCDVAVWATGADPHTVTAESDLDILKGFFRVNDFMQSTSHPNVFGGGDCVQMENYVDKAYPTKAGVYAVRAGPIVTQNVMNYVAQKPLVKYVPQTGFLSLLMTGDGRSIGSKFGISFYGTWVWRMKDYIDMSFMNLFNPNYLWNDYQNKGTSEQIEDYPVLISPADEDKMKQHVDQMSVEDAGQILGCSADEEEFHERLAILTRMHFDEGFRDGVVRNFKPPYMV